MSIILTILKVIGIILLIILLIILAVLLLVLFVPFRYSAGGRKEGDVLEFSGKVTWLLRAVTVQIGYEPGGAGLTKDLRIFGISLFKLRDKLRSRKKGSGSADSGIEENAEKATGDEITVLEAEGAHQDPGPGTEAVGGEESALMTDFGKESEDLQQEDGEQASALQPENEVEFPAEKPEAAGEVPGDHPADEFEAFAVQRAAGEETDNEIPEDVKTEPSDRNSYDSTSAVVGSGLSEKPEKITSRVRAVYNKLKDRLFSALSGIALKLNGITGKLFNLVLKVFIRICLLPLTIVEKLDKILRKIGSICRKIGAVYDFFFDVRVQEYLSEIMSLIKKLIGHVLPRKLIGYVRFGLDDPGYTGRVLAAVAPFYPKYGRYFSVQPDFEELVLEGKAELKGRVYLFYVAFIGIRAILNKNTKYVIRELKKLKEVR